MDRMQITWTHIYFVKFIELQEKYTVVINLIVAAKLPLSIVDVQRPYMYLWVSF